MTPTIYTDDHRAHLDRLLGHEPSDRVDIELRVLDLDAILLAQVERAVLANSPASDGPAYHALLSLQTRAQHLRALLVRPPNRSRLVRFEVTSELPRMGMLLRPTSVFAPPRPPVVELEYEVWRSA